MTSQCRLIHVRVCLVTTEFHGLFKNGGIGTANTSLALALASAGFEVTVAFADADENGPRVKEGNFDELVDRYRSLGVTLDFIPAGRLVPKAFEDARSASFCVYLYLKQHRFDVVYFNDCGGHGFYSLLAKHAGVLPNAPRMYVVAHGPHEWVLELNALRYWDRQPVVIAYMERRCAELADALISPSQYLIDWMTSHGWVMPAHVAVLQNLVKLPDAVLPSLRGSEVGPIDEIVFFGRLEPRKGIELFCNAIDLLNRSVDLSNVRITFLGKFSQIGGLHSGVYTAERARPWLSSLRLLSKYGQEEALDYLNRPGVLAVIPSLAENSPCVVAECMQLHLPFVATGTGGTAELVSPEERDLALVEPTPQALADRLRQILQNGQRPAHRAVSEAATLSRWLEVTAAGIAGNSGVVESGLEPVVQAEGAASPLVSICLVLSSLPSRPANLIDSLLQQSYPNLEFILVDDSARAARRDAAVSAFASARGKFPVNIVPGPPGDRGAARAAAAAQATGEYLLLLDEDAVIPMPECVQTFVAAIIRTSAGIVAGVPLQFQHSGIPTAGRDGWLGFFPLGGCLELGAFENCFGAGVFLVDRRAITQVGGFSASGEPGVDDWLLLATSVLAGVRLTVVPEPVFWCRTGPAAQLNHAIQISSYRRILDAYSTSSIGLIRSMIEPFSNVDQPNQARHQTFLAGIGLEAREIALSASSCEPNSWPALRGLVQFMVERHKIEDALDFARHNGASYMADVIDSAKSVAEGLALDRVRSEKNEFWHEFPITAEVRQRVKLISAPIDSLTLRPGLIAQYPLEPGVTVLKAHAVCPPDATSVRVSCSVSALDPQSISLAIVASALNTRMRLSERGLDSTDPFWWSDWVAAEDGTGQELTISLPSKSEVPLDLYFLSRTASDFSGQGRVTWHSAAATIPVMGTITLAAQEPALPSTPISLQILEQGTLLTHHSDFPFPVFVPGHPTLLHPLPGRITVVRIPGAVPAGTKGLKSVVSLEREESHPVQFGVWIRKSDSPASVEIDFTEADIFSGWFSVEQTLKHHSFTVQTAGRATETMDLYLATRVVEFPDVHFCHAVWHELLLLE